MTDVAAALIWDQQGRFLICRRPMHKANAGLWEFVGGKAEPGETLQQTLIRECKEELDILVEPGNVFTALVHEYPFLTIRLTLFHCKILSGQPKLLEHMDIRWIYPSEIPQVDFCPADEEILKKLMLYSPQVGV